MSRQKLSAFALADHPGLSLLLLAPLALAQQAQVYLYPPPSDSSSSPSLTAEQAEVVIAHHLGDGIENRPTPQDEGLWGHLLNVWQHEKRPRVVIVEGVDAQGKLVRWRA